jgi:uncharacterized protein YajQ (UPF0234 family)
MAKDSSSDVVSEYDLSTMINACDQASREIATVTIFKALVQN